MTKDILKETAKEKGERKEKVKGEQSPSKRHFQHVYLTKDDKSIKPPMNSYEKGSQHNFLNRQNI